MKNFLIVKLSAIGDVIHALPVAGAIKKAYPDSHLTWAVEPAASPLIEMNKYVDEVIIFKKKEFKTLGGFIKNFSPLKKQIQAREYDAVLDLQGLFKSAVIAKMAKSPKKIGTEWMREGSALVSTPIKGAHAEGHIVDRYLDVAAAVGGDTSEPDFGLVNTNEDFIAAWARLKQAGVPEGSKFAAIVVGASWGTKRWGAKNFAALADWLYTQKIIPVLTGGGAVEEQIAAEICQNSDIPPINLVSKTTLPVLAAVYHEAQLVIGGDTGPSHLAAAVGTPTLMLFGPTLGERNHSYGQDTNWLYAKHDCRGCRRPVCPKKIDCMADIKLPAVTDKLTQMLRDINFHAITKA